MKDNYPDTGCEAAPLCLRCPLPQCKHDVPAQSQRRYARDYQVALAEGLTVGATANLLGVSERTIFRAKARLKA